jgi:hypothetical protein
MGEKSCFATLQVIQPGITSSCAISTWPAPIRRRAPDNRPGVRPISSRSRTALGKRAKLDVLGTDYPTQGARTLNCGYSHGFSVLEVIDTVKQVSGVDFRVDFAPRHRAIGSFRRVGLEVALAVYDLTDSGSPVINVALHEWLGLFAYWAFGRTKRAPAQLLIMPVWGE